MVRKGRVGAANIGDFNIRGGGLESKHSSKSRLVRIRERGAKSICLVEFRGGIKNIFRQKDKKTKRQKDRYGI